MCVCVCVCACVCVYWMDQYSTQIRLFEVQSNGKKVIEGSDKEKGRLSGGARTSINSSPPMTP